MIMASRAGLAVHKLPIVTARTYSWSCKICVISIWFRAVFFITRATNSSETNNCSPHSLAAAFPYGIISMAIMLFANKAVLNYTANIHIASDTFWSSSMNVKRKDSSLITSKKLLLVTLPTQSEEKNVEGH